MFQISRFHKFIYSENMPVRVCVCVCVGLYVYNVTYSSPPTKTIHYPLRAASQANHVEINILLKT